MPSNCPGASILSSGRDLVLLNLSRARHGVMGPGDTWETPGCPCNAFYTGGGGGGALGHLGWNAFYTNKGET